MNAMVPSKWPLLRIHAPRVSKYQRNCRAAQAWSNRYLQLLLSC